jgi:hydrogenase expression/formation protein HypC
MCLAVPGLVVELDSSKPPFTSAVVEFDGIKRRVSLACVPEVTRGDYVLVHAGVAISIIDAAEAAKVIDALKQLDLEEDFANQSLTSSRSNRATDKFLS